METHSWKNTEAVIPHEDITRNIADTTPGNCTHHNPHRKWNTQLSYPRRQKTRTPHRTQVSNPLLPNTNTSNPIYPRTHNILILPFSTQLIKKRPTPDSEKHTETPHTPKKKSLRACQTTAWPNGPSTHYIFLSGNTRTSHFTQLKL
jgi:hypothetical protein